MVAPFLIFPFDSSSSTLSKVVVMIMTEVALCAFTRTSSCTLVGLPRLHTTSHPTCVRWSTPASRKAMVSCSSICRFDVESFKSTILEAASGLEGGTRKGGNSHRAQVSFCRIHTDLKNAICTTSFAVVSFHPRISVWFSSTTLLFPSRKPSVKDVTASVMKPIRIEKNTRPKATMAAYTQRWYTDVMLPSMPPVANTWNAVYTPDAQLSLVPAWSPSASLSLASYHKAPSTVKHTTVTVLKSV
mmetsp:Transcript_56962/g.114221  ORF Transcript_56962/g.114221 Transcript_56962/m.114221 type:complete len:244 (+) Transcript_56962:348-1079(+)